MSKTIENKRRVVISGIGPVSSNGIGKDELWSNILSQKFVAEPIPEKYKQYYDYKTKFYVPFPEINLDDFSFIKIFPNDGSNSSFGFSWDRTCFD